MFAEAGVAEPTDIWTWDDYANAANTIHEKLGIYGCSSMLTLNSSLDAPFTLHSMAMLASTASLTWI